MSLLDKDGGTCKNSSDTQKSFLASGRCSRTYNPRLCTWTEGSFRKRGKSPGSANSVEGTEVRLVSQRSRMFGGRSKKNDSTLQNVL